MASMNLMMSVPRIHLGNSSRVRSEYERVIRVAREGEHKSV